MYRLGVITGLAQESACLDIFPSETRPDLRCAGSKSERAGFFAQKLINEGCNGLLSFGMAGGLKEDLPPGNLILASIVFGPKGQVFETSKLWLKRICSQSSSDISVTIAPMIGANEVICSSKAKKELGIATEAVAVDMESHQVGAVAKKAGVPFMVIRAIADPVGCSIPDWLSENISERGAPQYGSILLGLASHPWDFNKLMQLNRNSSTALSSLRSIANRLGPLFAFE